MKLKQFICIGLSCLLTFIPMLCLSQRWDDANAGSWPDSFVDITIPSSQDGEQQHAMFRKSRSSEKRPLIVSLHTWSGNYQQYNSWATDIEAYDYVFIQPDFRGPNNRPEACCSELVISDIQDAINYAIRHANVDPQEVHIIGTSGGGYAALFCFMKIAYPVKSFSAWVPISDFKRGRTKTPKRQKRSIEV